MNPVLGGIQESHKAEDSLLNEHDLPGQVKERLLKIALQLLGVIGPYRWRRQDDKLRNIPNGCLSICGKRCHLEVNTGTPVRRHVMKLHFVPAEENVPTRSDTTIWIDHVIPKAPAGKPIEHTVRRLEAHEVQKVLFVIRYHRSEVTMDHVQVRNEFVDTPLVNLFLLAPGLRHIEARKGATLSGRLDIAKQVQPTVIT